MPKLVKLYIRNVAIGFAIAALFVAMLLYFNVLNLWTIIQHHPDGILAVFLLWFMNGIVFAGVQFAFAVMQLGRKDDDDDHHGGTAIREFVPILIPVDQTRKGRQRR